MCMDGTGLGRCLLPRAQVSKVALSDLERRMHEVKRQVVNVSAVAQPPDGEAVPKIMHPKRDEVRVIPHKPPRNLRRIRCEVLAGLSKCIQEKWPLLRVSPSTLPASPPGVCQSSVRGRFVLVRISLICREPRSMSAAARRQLR
jgi:hypothetical protein